MAEVPAPHQLPLDLGIEVEKTVGGLEMGVLQNGIPYLTQTGLASMSGAARATVFEITQEWAETFNEPIPTKGRMAFFKEYLFQNGYTDPQLFIEITKNGTPHYAYPDLVCMAFVEYFAFESQRKNETAMANYRRVARFGLQQFVYRALDYAPPDEWKHFHARVSLLKDSAPDGYFIIFKESSGLAADLIANGLTVNEFTLPDQSVGITWGRYWTEHDLALEFGDRIEYPHYYPPEFPQSASNPQKAWAYPDGALAEFRRWFRAIYLTTKYPAYILRKAKILSDDTVKHLTSMYEPKKIEK